MIETLALIGQLFRTGFRVIGIRGAIILALLLAICGIFVFYEGVPLVKDVPFVDDIPGIGNLAIGRVQVRVNAAVSAAQHAFAIQAENAASKAKADAEAESARQAVIVNTEFNNRLASDQARQAKISKDLDNALARNAELRAAGGKGVKCPPDDGIPDILRHQGFTVD